MEEPYFNCTASNSIAIQKVDTPRARSIRARASFNGNLRSGPQNDWMRSRAALDATHFTVRLAAFAALIADVTDNSTIVIGTDFANRNHVETQNIVGPFVNMVHLVFSYDANKTFLEWLEIVRDRVFEATTRS